MSKTMRMKPPRALFPLLILLAWHVPLRVDSTNFYIDPDWTGAHRGTASQPWAQLDSSGLDASGWQRFCDAQWPRLLLHRIASGFGRQRAWRRSKLAALLGPA